MELRPQQLRQQKQSLSITGQVIQSIRLLQLGNHELEDFLREQADDNPLVTVVVGTSDVQTQAQAAQGAAFGRCPHPGAGGLTPPIAVPFTGRRGPAKPIGGLVCERFTTCIEIAARIWHEDCIVIMVTDKRCGP